LDMRVSLLHTCVRLIVRYVYLIVEYLRLIVGHVGLFVDYVGLVVRYVRLIVGYESLIVAYLYVRLIVRYVNLIVEYLRLIVRHVGLIVGYVRLIGGVSFFGNIVINTVGCLNDKQFLSLLLYSTATVQYARETVKNENIFFYGKIIFFLFRCIRVPDFNIASKKFAVQLTNIRYLQNFALYSKLLIHV
jgi:hypothetical protein